MNNMLTSDEFCAKAREIVVDYFNEHVEVTDNRKLTVEDTYIVWFSFILGSQKCLISTLVSDGMYYEVTYNKNTNEIYLDAYKKWQNRKIIL